MKKYFVAGIMGCALGVFVSVKVAGPVLAQDTETKKTIYEQLDLFGDIFERIRSEYVEEVSSNCLLYTSPSPRDGLLSRMPSSA